MMHRSYCPNDMYPNQKFPRSLVDILHCFNIQLRSILAYNEVICNISLTSVLTQLLSLLMELISYGSLLKVKQSKLAIVDSINSSEECL